jgi:hypothetical protein
LAIALTEHLAHWLRVQLPCPVITVKHPCQIPEQRWELAKWSANSSKMLVGIGWYLRNTRLLHQATIPPGMAPLRLLPRRPHIQHWDSEVKQFWVAHGRWEWQPVATVGYVGNRLYDEILCQNVIATEVFDASASNGVLDCIVRNTPLIVNRHPAIVEYLGEDYPLFFDDPNGIADIPHSKIEQAAVHLQRLDLSWANGDAFGQAISEGVKEHV